MKIYVLYMNQMDLYRDLLNLRNCEFRVQNNNEYCNNGYMIVMHEELSPLVIVSIYDIIKFNDEYNTNLELRLQNSYYALPSHAIEDLKKVFSRAEKFLSGNAIFNSRSLVKILNQRKRLLKKKRKLQKKIEAIEKQNKTEPLNDLPLASTDKKQKQYKIVCPYECYIIDANENKIIMEIPVDNELYEKVFKNKNRILTEEELEDFF